MSWINPKLNWTEDDYYNAADFNRVENNTLEVANYLSSILYTVPLKSTVTNRNTTSIDFLSSINRIEDNIEIIKNSFIAPPGWQNKKLWITGEGFSYLDAIRLENNLALLYEWAFIAKDNIKYSGTFSCGEEVILNA